MAYDNIDRLEGSLSGAGTTLRVNGNSYLKSFHLTQSPSKFD